MKRLGALILFVLYCISTPSIVTAQSQFNDVTSQLVDLGIPSKKAGYAKNIWDLFVYENKIYIGTGNSSNAVPNSNAGPIPIISFNPDTNTYTDEFIVDEEQIEVFRVLDGVLTIPGHDSRESHTLGNFYRLESTGWKKYRTIPNGIHVYDMVSFQGKWFAALGNDGTKPTVMVSTNQGLSWQGLPATQSNSEVHRGRVHRLYVINNTLLINDFGGLYQFGTTDFGPPSITNWKNMLPDFSGYLYSGQFGQETIYEGSPINARFERAVTFNRTYVYIGADYTNDHQWTSEGLYKTEQIGTATKIQLPNNIKPWDIFIRGERLYVLGSIKIDATHYVNTVVTTTDLQDWEEILRFNADTFSRSFEEFQGNIYFGLGSDTITIPLDTGKLLKVPLPAVLISPTTTSLPKPADANGDNRVNGQDYIIWLNHYNQTVSGITQGDFNGDNRVDGRDYILWLNNYTFE